MKPKLLLLPVVLILAATILWSCRNTRTPDMYLIPQNYVGWVIVSAGVKGSPPLPLYHGYRLIVVPQAGEVRTSTHAEPGVAFDKYYYYDVHTKKILKEIDQKDVHINGYYQFFVGSDAMYKADENKADKHYGRPGNRAKHD